MKKQEITYIPKHILTKNTEQKYPSIVYKNEMDVAVFIRLILFYLKERV